MVKQRAICWIPFATIFCGAVSATAFATHSLPGNTWSGQGEHMTVRDISESPLLLARRDRHEWHHDRYERRREWRREARREWRRERRSDAIAAGVGGVIIGTAIGAAAASSQRQQYEQNIYNYPNYDETGYPYPQY